MTVGVGPPMGVMLSHYNLAWTAAMIAENQKDAVSEDSILVSYLPLSHIAEQKIP